MTSTTPSKGDRDQAAAPTVAGAEVHRGKNEHVADIEEVVSRQILDHARWMFEHDEKREETAQARAVVVLTLTATAVGLLTQVIPDTLNCASKVGLGLVLLTAVATVVCCVVVLYPRKRKDAMPAVAQLRELAADHNKQEPVPVPATQFAVDLLRADDLQQDSPLNVARNFANKRMTWLGFAYLGLAVTFALAILMVGLQAVI